MLAKHWYQVVASKFDPASLCQVILHAFPGRHRDAGAGHPVMTIQVHAGDLATSIPGALWRDPAVKPVQLDLQ